jgi:hypothetical protein
MVFTPDSQTPSNGLLQSSESDGTAPIAYAGTGLPPIQSSEGEWERWFAWRPVHLYMTSHFVWLKTIYRRCVTKGGVETCDYTDTPGEFPGE